MAAKECQVKWSPGVFLFRHLDGLRRIPELHFWETDEERYAAVEAARVRQIWTVGYWVRVAPLFVGMAAFSRVWMRPVMKLFTFLANYLTEPVAAVAIAGFFLWGICEFVPILFVDRIRNDLRKQLIEAGIPVCQACGYDMRGNTVGQCPECGRMPSIK